MLFRQVVLFDGLPDDGGGEAGAVGGGMFAVGTVEFKRRIFGKAFPPFDADRGEQGVDLLRAGRVGVRQFRLLFGMAFFRPRHVHDRRRSGLSDPFAELRNRLVHRLFGTKRMRVFLQDDVVVAAVLDVEADLRLLHVLRQMPSAKRQHHDVATDIVFQRLLREHLRHGVDVGVAVADEEDFEIDRMFVGDGLDFGGGQKQRGDESEGDGGFHGGFSEKETTFYNGLSTKTEKTVYVNLILFAVVASQCGMLNAEC